MATSCGFESHRPHHLKSGNSHILRAKGTFGGRFRVSNKSATLPSSRKRGPGASAGAAVQTLRVRLNWRYGRPRLAIGAVHITHLKGWQPVDFRELSCRGSKSLNIGMSASTVTRETGGCDRFEHPIRQWTEVAISKMASFALVQTYALWRSTNLAKAASWSATAFRVGSSLSSSVSGSNLV